MSLQGKGALVVVMFIFIIATRYLAQICALADTANTVFISKTSQKSILKSLFPPPLPSPQMIHKQASGVLTWKV